MTEPSDSSASKPIEQSLQKSPCCEHVWIRCRNILEQVFCHRKTAERILAFATVVLAVFAGKALIDTREVLETNERAWISPEPPIIEGDLISPLLVRIPFENTGKSAALNVVHFRNVYPFDVKLDGSGIPYIGPETNPWPINDQCVTDVMKLPVGSGATVYPGGKYSDFRYVFPGANDPKIARMKDKTASFAIYGCFSYLTFSYTRHSPYCFYWQAYRDKEIKDATFETCPVSVSTIRAD